MKTYWNMLEWKRIQLENEEKDQKMVQDARTTLTRNIRHIQLDLRDLISQVSTQVSTVFLLKSTHISSSPFPVEEVTSKMVWYKICFAFSSRWALWEALGKGQQLLWHKHAWTQQAGPGQYGTAEWKVTSSWGIWTFTSPSWQETFFYWLRKYSHDSKLKKDNTHTHTHAHKVKEKKGRNSWTDSQHFDQTGKIVIVFIQVFLLTFREGLWLLRVCFLFLLILRAFLGISQSFCLTSDCKLDMSFQNGENASQHPVFPPTPSI